MSDVELIGYTAEYPSLDLELMNDEEKYSMALIVLHIEEFKKQMKVSKVYKTTKKGTKVKFELIKNEQEAEEYYEKIKDMIQQHHDKYGK